MIFTLLGWAIGVAIGLALGTAVLVSLAVSLPAIVLSIISVLPTLPLAIPPLVAVLVLVAFYVTAYGMATASLVAVLPPFTTPLGGPVPTPGGVSVRLAPATGELFSRGLLLGATAILNAMTVLLLPGAGPFLSVWCFVVISLAVIPPVAISPFYHGFLGWTGWLCPMSWFATAVGLLLFLVNAPFAFAALGTGAFRLDFSTGVIETTDGITHITGFGGGFSLGNFNFLARGNAQRSFLLRNLSSHETGHSLNTAAMGGVVLWINAVDENLAPLAKFNFAYGELAAESHAQGLPPDVITWADFFITKWG
jgi:hypothetical protein